MLQNKKNLSLVIGVILLAVLVPQHQTNAGLFDFAVSEIAQQVGSFIIGLVGQAISWAAQAFDAFIRYQTTSGTYNIIVVDQSWTIIRNFVNLFFILVLIIMAFGTIFDLKNYTWKDMLAPFLIAALLINFSLAIGQYIITVSNGLAGVFLKEIAGNGSLSERLAQGFSQSGIITATTGAGGVVIQTIDATFSTATTTIFAIIWLIIILLVFVSLFIFAIVRLLVLWFMLIISPIAWFGYALPNLRPKTWTTWWNNFLCWCFFLPYYLFFLMFAIIFISNKDKIPSVPGTASVVLGTMTLNNILFYGITLILLIYGLDMAKKLACASGSRVGMVFGAIETGVRKYAPGAAYVRGGVAGLKERGEEIKEKGVFGIGGAQKGRLDYEKAKGWIAGIPGLGQVPGAREAASKAQAAEVDKEVKRLQILNLTLDQLNEKLKTAKGPEKIAAFKLKTENGWLENSDADVFAAMIREAGGGKTALGSSLIQSGVKGGFERMADGIAEKEAVYAKFVSADAELAKAFGLNAAKSNAVRDEGILKSLLQLVSTGTEAEKEKAHKLIQKNIENVYRTKAERAAFISTPVTDAWDEELKRMAAETMVNKGENDVANIEKVVSLFGGRDSSGKIKTKEAQNLYEKMLENVAKGNVAEMRESFDSQKALFNGLTDPDLQKAFGRAMAKSRTVNDEAILEKVLALYASDTEEIQKQVAEEVQKNIENIAKTSQDRKNLVNNTSGTTSEKLRKIAANVLVDKNEVDNWAMKQTVLNLYGGTDSTGNAKTIEGSDISRKVADGNVAMKEEVRFRKDKLPTDPTIMARSLTSAEYTTLESEVVTNIQSGLIRSMSTEDLKSPLIFNALYNGYTSGALSADQFNKAVGLVSPTRKKGAPIVMGDEIKGKPDRKKREAINELVNAVKTKVGPKPYP